MMNMLNWRYLLRRAFELKEYLLNRGYKREEVQQQIDRATSVDRTETLTMSENNNTDRVPLVVTYHPQLPCFGRILQNHLPTLHISETMKEAVPNPPLVANRRPKNLNDLLVRVMMNPPQQLYEGNSLCGRPCCKSCMHIQTGITFDSATMGEKFHSRITANCKIKTSFIWLSAANV